MVSRQFIAFEKDNAKSYLRIFVMRSMSLSDDPNSISNLCVCCIIRFFGKVHFLNPWSPEIGLGEQHARWSGRLGGKIVL